MMIFDADTQAERSSVNKYLESKIKAPYVYSQVSTLGGVKRAAALIKVSLDPRSKSTELSILYDTFGQGWRDGAIR